MASHKNKIIVASAGGRKTTSLVEEALAQKNKKILITTYTQENLDQIKSYAIEKNGCIPDRITISSWFTFLLRDGVKPYQYFIIKERKVKSIDFVSTPSRFIKKNTEEYYINSIDNIYSDKASDFTFQANLLSKGLVIKRLEDIFDQIYIDEMQDLSGWDLDFVEALLDSKIEIIMVGDPRQATYATNNSVKNKNKKGKNMQTWLGEISKKKKCELKINNYCFRSNQDICNFADSLYPDLPKSISKNTEKTGHDGIIKLKKTMVLHYISKYKPIILRWNKTADTMNLQAINIGLSKGRTYDRVLIFPTRPMLNYLNTSDPKKAGDKSKFYVAVTRAKYSVAFVID